MELRSKQQNDPNTKTQGHTKHNGTQVTPTSNEVPFFLIIQMGLHHRTAWNAAFTTWKKAAQNLHFFPDHHVQRNAGYKAPCAKDPSITPAVAPAGAAPSSSSTSSSTKHQTSSSTKHSDVQVPSKTVLGTRPERGSERGANEVRTRSEGDPQSFTNFTAYPAEEQNVSLQVLYKDASSRPFCEHVQYHNFNVEAQLTATSSEFWIWTTLQLTQAFYLNRCWIFTSFSSFFHRYFTPTTVQTCCISQFQHGPAAKRVLVRLLGWHFRN